MCLIRVVLFIGSVFVALATSLAVLSQITGISFEIYSYLIGISFIGAVMLGWGFNTHLQNTVSETRLTWVQWLVLGLLGAFIGYIALCATQIRLDEYNYLPNAVYVLQYPHEPMSFNLHFLYAVDKPLISYHWTTAIGYDYTQAGIAYLTGVHFFDIRFIITPILFGIALVLGYYDFFSYFLESNLQALTATGISLAILLLMGDTHYTPLNFTLLRSFEGKSIFASLFIPLIIVNTLRYFEKPSFWQWLMVWSVLTASVGLTPSALANILFLLPAIMMGTLVSDRLEYKDSKQVLRHLVLYGLSYNVVMLYGMIALFTHSNTPPAGDSALDFFTSDFWGNAKLWLHDSYPLTLIFIVIGFLLIPLIPSRPNRLFIMGWLGTLCLTALNPLLATPIIKTITTEAIYWRLFNNLQIQLVVALALVSLFYPLPRRYRMGVLSGFAIAWLIFVLVSPTSIRYAQGNWFWTEDTSYEQVGLWRLRNDYYTSAEAVVEIAPDGPMLAPLPLGRYVLLVSGNHPQVATRGYETMFWATTQGETDRERLINAAEFASDKPQYEADFRYFLAQYGADFQSIVLYQVVLDKNPMLEMLLNEAGFIQQQTVDYYVVFYR